MFLKCKIKYDWKHLAKETDRISSIWMNSDDEAVSLMSEYYDILKRTDLPTRPYDDIFQYSYTVWHLGEAKAHFINKDYISAACEIFQLLKVYPCLGVKETVLQLLEKEVINNEVFQKEKKVGCKGNNR